MTTPASRCISAFVALLPTMQVLQLIETESSHANAPGACPRDPHNRTYLQSFSVYHGFSKGNKENIAILQTMEPLARAKRHDTPGQLWHLTHRCHTREFLINLLKNGPITTEHHAGVMLGKL